MNKSERVPRKPVCIPLPRAGCPRYGQRFGLIETLLLLVLALLLASCDSGNGFPVDGDASSTGPGTPAAPGGPVQMIAFSREVGGQLDLFAIAEDGTGLTPLVSAAGDEVFAGATGSLVVYVRDMGGQNDIFTINDDGTGGGTLTNDLNDELPVAMTADGRVVFMRTPSGPTQSDLFSVKADGSGGVIPLATSVDAEIFDRLASGGRVVFQRLEGGTQFDIYSNLADGTGGVIPLATTAAIDEISAGVTTGNRIVFARTVGGLQNDILTISADGAGGESSLVATADDEIPVDVTASDLVIFVRTAGTVMNLLSIDASGVPAEAPLAAVDVLATLEVLLYGGSTAGGRVIYHRCDLFNECDVFSRNADGSGIEAILAADPVLNEVFVGVSSDGLIIIARDNGVTTELISINADGTGETPLASAPTPVAPGEVFKGVTANGRVIFERDVGGQTDLFSILADGSGPEVPLATALTDESFGGIF